MSLHELAGQTPPRDYLVDVPRLISAYYQAEPLAEDPSQRIAFGTSGHRGSSLNTSFNEAHIAAVTAALVEYRQRERIDGPVLIGFDTHALAWPAFMTTVEVLAAAGVPFRFQHDNAPTPTPVISQAIIAANRAGGARCDGIILTPSHNPPGDGGFKYNPPHGGPADTDATGWIERRANELLVDWQAIRRQPFDRAIKSDAAQGVDFIRPYVEALDRVIDMQAIAKAGVSIGVDPMGGAGLPYWEPIAEHYGLDLTVVNRQVEPDFRFIPLDHDGKIRMDCSSPYAMAGLLKIKDRFDVAFGNDTDADRHGIVSPEGGLINPNHFLSVSIDYLFGHRKEWGGDLKVGKTAVSSSMIDRVAGGLGREVYETPVGIKWFQPGLTDGWLGFGGEESAGATFLARNGEVWNTDKDGLTMGLLAAEILAVTGEDVWARFNRLVDAYGQPFYARRDAALAPEQKARFKGLDPDSLGITELAGESVTGVRTRAPGNDAPIGGLKVETANGWFAARPSGTEPIYKIYAESFHDAGHLEQILEQAQRVVGDALGD
ncbi:phosphoglucomutase (alpha-D-glucose-1,6-bisphosphate-dependent) [Guyparkeria hydrothermalis]|uniref:phosphoglucomutase (alpha-D-glucose-1,6-bisphosphate-dependent) n=1 Tax=Guyparkeria hydrothermalis TaxID=923 RepID=UPI002021CAEB|nr:phosphoglucomutase (alpha-D-glucose-1,6-bisphosphate-dependent) [Guyparkeria hydrothermalis]MCL7743389.1 phosphoglucomutase (alpha-D-glucose-1,6-bisphosphate-dependent) [Guyparkeria hydrothermalis]